MVMRIRRGEAAGIQQTFRLQRGRCFALPQPNDDAAIISRPIVQQILGSGLK
jgi:hypothetical protein